MHSARFVADIVGARRTDQSHSQCGVIALRNRETIATPVAAIQFIIC